MIARTHDTAAITALAVVFLLMPPSSMTLSTAILSILAVMIGGVAPDLDQPTAPFWRNLTVGRFFGKLFGKALGGHRFLSHSLIGLALFVFVFHTILSFFQPVMATANIGLITWAFGIGMASHLIMDTLTKEGVPWLLPIPYKFGWPPIRAWRVTTDKWVETKVIYPLLIMFNAVFLFLHYDQIVYILQNSIVS